MKIIIMSDSHGSPHKLDFVFRKHPNADLYLHLGDGERDFDTVLAAFPDLMPRAYHVKGNCDFASMSPDYYVLPTEGGHFLYVTHGHKNNVSYGKRELMDAAKEKNCDIILFGHTHCRYESYKSGLWLFNPGSVSLPRDGKPGSYGILEVNEKGVLFSHGDV